MWETKLKSGRVNMYGSSVHNFQIWGQKMNNTYISPLFDYKKSKHWQP